MDFGIFWRPQNAPFCTYDKIWGSICISVPLPQILGGLVPPPPWSTPMSGVNEVSVPRCSTVGGLGSLTTDVVVCVAGGLGLMTVRPCRCQRTVLTLLTSAAKHSINSKIVLFNLFVIHRNTVYCWPETQEKYIYITSLTISFVNLRCGKTKFQHEFILDFASNVAKYRWIRQYTCKMFLCGHKNILHKKSIKTRPHNY